MDFRIGFVTGTWMYGALFSVVSNAWASLLGLKDTHYLPPLLHGKLTNSSGVQNASLSLA